jgi:hypothetical protein
MNAAAARARQRRMDAPQHRLRGLLRLRLGNGSAHQGARLMRVIKGHSKACDPDRARGLPLFDLWQNWVRSRRHRFVKHPPRQR